MIERVARLADRIAIITGAGSGIGRATAQCFLREGAAVVGGIFEPGDDPGPGVTAVHCDVTSEADVRQLVDTAVARHGGLDILVNNAGIGHSGLVTETTDGDWQRVMDVNLRSLLLLCRHGVPQLLRRGGGAIVNVASINAIRGNHRLVAYAASKGGVVAATRALALDYAEHNIRVNCVCPASIEGTRMWEAGLPLGPERERRLAYHLAKHPMGRFGRPEEVAAAILFLASGEASFITGVALPIDGGRSIR